MLNKKEIISIVIASIIIAFSITLVETIEGFFRILVGVLGLILINVFVKKMVAYHFESEINVKLWEFKRWGYKPKQYFKKAFPAGAFFPIISRIIFFPLNGFVWMASLTFDINSTAYKSAKRHGIYSFSKISDLELAVITGAGIFANILIAILAYLINFPEFAKLNIWFAFFNILPLSNLDGNKLFFGSKVIWTFLATITLIGLALTIFIA